MVGTKLRDHDEPIPEHGKHLPLEEVTQLTGHSGWISSVSVTPGNEKVVSTSDDGTVRVFSISSGKCLHTFDGERNSSHHVVILSAQKIATVGINGNVLVCDILTGSESRFHTNIVDEAVSACASLQGGCFLVGGASGGLYKLVWDGKELKTLLGKRHAHKDWVRYISAGPNLAVTTSYDGKTKAWNAATLDYLATLEGHAGRVSCIATSCKAIVTGSEDQTLRVFETFSFECIRIIKAHSKQIWSVQILMKGTAVLSGYSDGTVSLHNISSGVCVWFLKVGIQIRSLHALSDKRILVAGGPPYDVNILSMSRVGESTLQEQVLLETSSSDNDAFLDLVPQTGPIKEEDELKYVLNTALSNQTCLNESCLLEIFRPEYVQTASDLLAGHWIVLLSTQSGFASIEGLSKLGNGRFLELNLYLPALKLRPSGAGTELIEAVFRHAWNLGFVTRYALEMALQDMTVLKKRFSMLAESIAALRRELDNNDLNRRSLQNILSKLSRDCSTMQSMLQRPSRQANPVDAVQSLFSFIPATPSLLLDISFTETELLLSTTKEDLILKNVDVSILVRDAVENVNCFQATRYAFLKECLGSMTANNRKDAVFSIRANLLKQVSQKVETFASECQNEGRKSRDNDGKGDSDTRPANQACDPPLVISTSQPAKDNVGDSPIHATRPLPSGIISLAA